MEHSPRQHRKYHSGCCYLTAKFYQCVLIGQQPRSSRLRTFEDFGWLAMTICARWGFCCHWGVIEESLRIFWGLCEEFEDFLRTLRFIRLDHTKNRCRKWGGVVLEMVCDHPRIKLHPLRTPFPNTFLTRFLDEKTNLISCSVIVRKTKKKSEQIKNQTWDSETMWQVSFYYRLLFCQKEKGGKKVIGWIKKSSKNPQWLPNDSSMTPHFPNDRWGFLRSFEDFQWPLMTHSHQLLIIDADATINY